MKQIIIDRNTWIRGEGSGLSYLLRKMDNHRCCLGFLSQQCGIPDKQLLGSPSVESALCKEFGVVLPDELAFLMDRGNNSSLAYKLMKLNDNHDISNEDRERQLTEEFAKQGFELVFTN